MFQAYSSFVINPKFTSEVKDTLGTITGIAIGYQVPREVAVMMYNSARIAGCSYFQLDLASFKLNYPEYFV